MTKKNLVTIVTDNRLVSETIATAVGATYKHDNYYIGNGYAVTWTNGHHRGNLQTRREIRSCIRAGYAPDVCASLPVQDAEL